MYKVYAKRSKRLDSMIKHILSMKITARYAPQIWVIKDGQGHLLTEPGEVKQRWRQYFNTLYNDSNAVNIGYN